MGIVRRHSTTSEVGLTQSVGLQVVSDYIESDLIRWLFASIYTHVNGYAGEYELHYEGNDLDVMDVPQFAELRIDGPKITNPQKKLKIIYVEINLLFSTHIDPDDLYKHSRILGNFLRAFDVKIPLYRYGDGPLDDQSLIGCLRRVEGRRENVAVDNFGFIRNDTRIEQSTIEAHYKFEYWIGE